MPHPADNALDWFPDEKRYIPGPRGLQFDKLKDIPGAVELSAFDLDVLQSKNFSAKDVLTIGGTKDTFAVVFSLSVADATDCGYEVVRSDDDSTPINFAHVSVIDLNRSDGGFKTRRSKLAERMVHVYGVLPAPQ